MVAGREGVRRTLLMGRPHHFAGISPRSPNPADQRPKALHSRVDRDLAMRQWHMLAELLISRGFEVLAIAPDKEHPELALAGAAGILTDLAPKNAVADKVFCCATSFGKNAELAQVFERTIRGIGFQTVSLEMPFAGASDFFKCGKRYLFTPGHEPERSILSRVLPGRLAGGSMVFGSDFRVRERLSDFVPGFEVKQLRLKDPRFPRGDLAACALGPERRILMVYVDAFDDDARTMILSGKNKVAEYIIPLSDSDAAMYSANAFPYTDTENGHHIILPAGVSDELLARLETVGVHPITVDMSEWIKKERGSVRALLTDLGWIRDDRRTQTPEIQDFRKAMRVVVSDPSATAAAGSAATMKAKQGGKTEQVKKA